MNLENHNVALKNYCEKSGVFLLSRAIFLAATVILLQIPAQAAS